MNPRPSLLEHVDAHVCGWCRAPLAVVQRAVRLLGARRGDTLVDLYPGTGIVGRVWAAVSAEAA